MEGYLPSLLYDDRDEEGLAEEQIEDNITAVNQKLIEQMDELTTKIYAFKEVLFEAINKDDMNRDPSDKGGIYRFHSIFLQPISVWIGELDGLEIDLGIDLPDELLKEYDNITEYIKTLINESQDARTLIYSLLTTLSTEDLYDLKKRGE